eukprot:TRINITY_DN4563_c0_g1_i2.p1 TRINITY_DN4563_c0_g1~~TRINITY_DN4563_c0_g1_i2.p1  ORF type:complete len:304 (+),score=49.63 TRINITY_DN4563_c0_g1_i2:23-913(+)
MSLEYFLKHPAGVGKDKKKPAVLTATIKKRKKMATYDNDVIPVPLGETPKEPEPLSIPDSTNIKIKTQDSLNKSAVQTIVDKSKENRKRKKDISDIEPKRKKLKGPIEEKGLSYPQFETRVKRKTLRVYKALASHSQLDVAEEVKGFAKSYLDHLKEDNEMRIELNKLKSKKEQLILSNSRYNEELSVWESAKEYMEKKQENINFEEDLKKVNQLVNIDTSTAKEYTDNRIECHSAYRYMIERMLLQADQLTKTLDQIIHFGHESDKHFSKAASILREEEIGEDPKLLIQALGSER